MFLQWVLPFIETKYGTSRWVILSSLFNESFRYCTNWHAVVKEVDFMQIQ